jgi:hypothetical protein
MLQVPRTVHYLARSLLVGSPFQQTYNSLEYNENDSVYIDPDDLTNTFRITPEACSYLLTGTQSDKLTLRQIQIIDWIKDECQVEHYNTGGISEGLGYYQDCDGGEWLRGTIRPKGASRDPLANVEVQFQAELLT